MSRHKSADMSLHKERMHEPRTLTETLATLPALATRSAEANQISTETTTRNAVGRRRTRLTNNGQSSWAPRKPCQRRVYRSVATFVISRSAQGMHKERHGAEQLVSPLTPNNGVAGERTADHKDLSADLPWLD